MAKDKSGYMSQREKFIEAAREHGTDESPDAFRRAVRTLATARVERAKKAATKSKKAAKKRKRKA